jgi:predicted GTPase
MKLDKLITLRVKFEKSKLYTEALNISYLIKYAATNPIATNQTESTELPEDYFSPEDTNPENYIKKIWKLYYKDIKTVHFDRFVKKFMKEGLSEEDAKTKAEDKIVELVNKGVEKTVEGHSYFVSKLKELTINKDEVVVSPGSGFGHEQALFPDINFEGKEYQQNLVDMANQRNRQMGIPSISKNWSLTKTSPEESLGDDWKDKINSIFDDSGNVQAIYAKHACGGITDYAMLDAANKGIKKMLLATCCANRYTELSWKILQPKDALGTPLTFKEYEEIAKKSKSQDDSGFSAVKQIDNWREDFLRERGYEVERGRGPKGPFIKAFKE